MKRKTFQILAIIALVLVAFTSCSTSVALRTLVPASADVSGYKTIAVRSTEDATNWKYPAFRDDYIAIKSNVNSKYISQLRINTALDRNTTKNLAEYATANVSGALDTGFYTMIKPTVTDALVLVGKNMGTVREALNEKGVDAILSTSITAMAYDEYVTCEKDSYITKDKENKEFYKERFYVVQKYSVSLTYTLTDVENNVIIAYDTISKSGEKKTLVANTKNQKGDLEKNSYVSIEKSSSLIKALISDICWDLRLELAPHYQTEYFSLMANKPKVKSLKPAYKFVDDGDYRLALDLFLHQYNMTGHTASGYNACILYYALGEYDDAFALASELYYKNGSTKAVDLYKKMKDTKARQDAALQQITSTEKSAASPSNELIGF